MYINERIFYCFRNGIEIILRRIILTALYIRRRFYPSLDS